MAAGIAVLAGGLASGTTAGDHASVPVAVGTGLQRSRCGTVSDGAAAETTEPLDAASPVPAAYLPAFVVLAECGVAAAEVGEGLHASVDAAGVAVAELRAAPAPGQTLGEGTPVACAEVMVLSSDKIDAPFPAAGQVVAAAACLDLPVGAAFDLAAVEDAERLSGGFGLVTVVGGAREMLPALAVVLPLSKAARHGTSVVWADGDLVMPRKPLAQWHLARAVGGTAVATVCGARAPGDGARVVATLGAPSVGELVAAWQLAARQVSLAAACFSQATLDAPVCVASVPDAEPGQDKLIVFAQRGTAFCSTSTVCHMPVSPWSHTRPFDGGCTYVDRSNFCLKPWGCGRSPCCPCYPGFLLYKCLGLSQPSRALAPGDEQRRVVSLTVFAVWGHRPLAANRAIAGFRLAANQRAEGSAWFVPAATSVPAASGPARVGHLGLALQGRDYEASTAVDLCLTLLGRGDYGVQLMGKSRGSKLLTRVVGWSKVHASSCAGQGLPQHL